MRLAALGLAVAAASGTVLAAAGPALVYRDPQVLDLSTMGFPGIVVNAAFGDVTGDGRADCVVVTGDGYTYYFPGLPDGTVDPVPVPLDLTYKGTICGTVILSVVDVDGDGDVDVALDANWVPLVVLRNDGGGVFTKVVVDAAGEVLQGNRALFDLGGDGDLDLISSVYLLPYITDPGYRVWENVGGTFTAGARFSTPQSLVLRVADVDGDGLEDPVLMGLDETRVLLQKPGGVLEAQAPVAHAETQYAQSYGATTVDLDGDGDPDVITRGRRVLLNDGAGTLTPQAGPVSGPILANPKVADFDNDGLQDILDVPSGITVNLLRNAGGSFEAPVALATGITAGNGSRIALGDADGDGKTDVAHVNYSGWNMSILRQAGFPAPADLAVVPAILDEAGTVELDLSGQGLLAGATVEIGGGIEVTGVSVTSGTEATVTLDVAPGIGGGGRTVRFVNPDLQAASAALEVRSLDARLEGGLLRDDPAPARDRMRVRGGLPRNSLSAYGGFAGREQGLRLEIGSGATRFVLDVPAEDPRWREERGGRRLVWETLPTEFPRARLAVDVASERFDLRVSYFDYPQAPRDASLSAFAGTDLGRDPASWEPAGRAGRFRLR